MLFNHASNERSECFHDSEFERHVTNSSTPILMPRHSLLVPGEKVGQNSWFRERFKSYSFKTRAHDEPRSHLVQGNCLYKDDILCILACLKLYNPLRFIIK